jgi:rubredoxin
MDERKIAEESKVIEAIREILKRRLKVESQEELAELVLKKLKKEDKRYSLSPIRVKRIALKIPEVEVKAKTKRTLKLPKIEKCPVCEGVIEPVKIKNLLNKEIVIGYKCTSCGYESDLEAFMPMKYIFILKQRYK